MRIQQQFFPGWMKLKYRMDVLLLLSVIIVVVVVNVQQDHQTVIKECAVFGFTTTSTTPAISSSARRRLSFDKWHDHHDLQNTGSSLFGVTNNVNEDTDEEVVATADTNLQSDIQSSTDADLQQQQQQHNELMYVLGVNVARQIGDIRPLLVNVTNDIQHVTTGIVDTIIGRLSEQDQLLLLNQYQATLNTFIQERALILQEKLVKAGAEMLQLMAETEGAVILQPSNVVVHVLSSSSPNSTSTPPLRPTKTSIVRMHYHGTLADGTIFDSSLIQSDKKNEPINVPLAKLVPGLREGIVQRLQEGDIAMIGIPPEFGYGIITTPPNPNIPNNSTLF